MRAPLSVVIPTLDAEAELPHALLALMEGVGAGLLREVVVSDGGSRDGTLAVARDAGALVVAGPPGRGGQIRRGVAASGGPWLLVLHADTRLGAGWSDAARAHLEAGAASGAGWFRLRFRAEGTAPRAVERWVDLRSRMGLPYGDQGLLLPRALHDAVGGFEDIPLMEDVAMARALRGRLTALRAEAWTSAGRYEAGGWIRRGGRNLLTLGRYLAGADPDRLARSYVRR
jgi:rSAM/selenodomain-associated transferase 2